MSMEAVAWAFCQDVKPSGAKFVLVALANYDNPLGIFPGQATLGKMTGQSERTVRDHLAVLEADGVIRREIRKNSFGHRNTDFYRLVRFEASRIENQPATIAGRGETNRQISPSQPATFSGHIDEPEEEPKEPIDKESMGGSAQSAPVERGHGKTVYGAGKRLLGKYGIAAKRAGALITRWRKDFPDSDLIAVFELAGQEKRHDIVEYVQGCLRQNERAAPDKQRNPTADGVSPELAAHWDAIRQRLRAENGPGVYGSWIAPLRLEGVVDGAAVLSAASTYSANWVQSKYGAHLEKYWRERAGYEVRIIVAPDDAAGR